ncbi:Rad52/Rad22 family DNA repair protein [Williamsia sterculiae]|uniref:Rad52/22 family double-strand break repair protein n=1 Tax=Williamsia sterculiae TaxID=1344003 RepID=A0A1N7GHG5_9NOCA|nr:Rad52/Rad22 family DNA repair protein [Williamsia sterculiae]SIS11982.1 Rad52/22 family double-strand break repair protein [Williamsia sterculiae]
MADGQTITEQDHSTRTINLLALQAPFPERDIEWRAQRSGINRNGNGWVSVVAYIDNRAVQNRLDDVCGPENWRDEYDTSPVGGVLCGISIRVNGEWITKWDGADKTDVEPIKGGLSNAEKRAAVKWGIGRYLYRLESDIVQVRPSGDNYIAIKKNKSDLVPTIKGYWTPPALPTWARPVALESEKPAMADLIHSPKNAAPTPVQVDNPIRGAQKIQIKALYQKAGADMSRRDEWLARITTASQADQAIQQLRDKIEDNAAEQNSGE